MEFFNAPKAQSPLLLYSVDLNNQVAGAHCRDGILPVFRQKTNFITPGLPWRRSEDVAHYSNSANDKCSPLGFVRKSSKI